VSQQAKADTLRLDEWFDPVLFTTSRHAGFLKPGTIGFEWIATKWGLPNAELAYIADNPLKDFVGPRKLGWLTIRLRVPGQLRFALEPAGDGDQPDVAVAAAESLRGYFK